MTIKRFSLILLLFFMTAGCTREIECENYKLPPVFINFSRSDIDTFVLRKFKAHDNYQTLVDTFAVAYGSTGIYDTSHDTTSVFIPNREKGIQAGFDWQIFIPAKNKKVSVSDIAGEKKTGPCRRGIFSWDGPGCHCWNNVFSAKKDGQVINFPAAGTTPKVIYILN